MVETANLLEIIVPSTAKGERYQDNIESESITPIAPALLPNKTRRKKEKKKVGRRRNNNSNYTSVKN